MTAVLFFLLAGAAAQDYFPPPDSAGGWRRPARMYSALDDAFEFTKRTSQHGGLLVVRNGWLIYERYFGRANEEATPNNASVGKSFTSIAMGILLRERADLFPEGLEQKVFTRDYFPAGMFPLSDPRKARIKLGQLLAMSAGIRGNNPGMVHGQPVKLDPAGPDGWLATLDAMAFGKLQGPLNTITLWCEPGEGYSYATSSIHLVSVILRHVTGQELEEFVRMRIAAPLGWGRWGWGYKHTPLGHTAGGGGIAPRPRDMLRFGYLLLRKGRWGGRQIVPEDYVGKCSRSSPYNPHSPYSLQFDVNDTGQCPGLPRDLFWKTGSGGHAIFIVPSLDLVVYKMGGRDGQYAPEDTGVPPVPEFFRRYDGSRQGWKADVGSEEGYAETIRRVIAAIGNREP